MRVLFVSGEMIAGDLAYRLKKEGCDVKLFIEDESRKDCFENMVDKTDDWRIEPTVYRLGQVLDEDKAVYYANKNEIIAVSNSIRDMYV